jgi:hypothetical protein
VLLRGLPVHEEHVLHLPSRDRTAGFALLRPQSDCPTHAIMSGRVLPPDLRASERHDVSQTRTANLVTNIEEALHNLQDWKLGVVEEQEVKAWIDWIDKV